MNNGQIITRSKIIKGLKLFTALTVIGIIFILYRSSFTESFSSLRNFKISYLLIIIALVLFDWFFSAYRIYLFVSKVHPGITYGGCVRANLANIFLGGVTPSQTGGGAGQIYVLYKEGMHVIDATIVSFIGFLNTVIILPICGILINVLIKPEFENVALQYFSTTSIILFGLILAAVIFSLIDPGRFERVARSLLMIIPFLQKKTKESVVLKKFFEMARRYHDLMLYFMKRGRHILAAGFIMTAVIFFNKFVIAYAVISGLGIMVNFWQVIYLQLLLILIFYFSPTPGASGMAEVSSVFIMGQIVPKSHQGIFVLLWRFFTLFAGMTVGAYVLMRYWLQDEKEKITLLYEGDRELGAIKKKMRAGS
jgi:uncharacterized protein (TIRG00374 family)